MVGCGKAASAAVVIPTPHPVAVVRVPNLPRAHAGGGAVVARPVGVARSVRVARSVGVAGSIVVARPVGIGAGQRRAEGEASESGAEADRPVAVVMVAAAIVTAV